MTVEISNGHVAGRDVPELPTFTFKDSGRRVQIQRLSPLTIDEINKTVKREFPPPAPPIINVAYGDQTRPEENRNDPDYQRLYAEWEAKNQERASARLTTLVALRAVVLDMGSREYDELYALREDLALIGVALPDDSKLTPEQNAKMQYVLHICTATDTEISELIQAVTQRSRPSEAQISEHL